MAELNSKPFLPQSGFLGRIFKGFPAYYAEPDLRQYFESIEYNLNLLNNITVGESEGQVVLQNQSGWNVQRNQYTLRLTLTDPFKVKVGKTELNFTSANLDYIDVRTFDGNTNLNDNTLMLDQVTHVVVLADKRIISYNEDPIIGGVSAPGMVQPLESSDAEYYENFSVNVYKGAELPELIDDKHVVCILAQFTFYFDGYWKPLLIQNLRTDIENADSSGGNKFPIMNKHLGVYGRIELINQLVNTLNNLSLKIDGSNDALADIYVDKGQDGRFKIITEEDYATTTNAGISRFANNEDLENLSPSVSMTPFSTRKLMGFERKSFALGGWNMNTEDTYQITHGLTLEEYQSAVVVGVSVYDNTMTSVKDMTSYEGNLVELDINNITFNLKDTSFFHTEEEYGTVPDVNFNRGFIVLDILKDYVLPDASAPIVDAGTDQSLTISALEYGTPLLKSVKKVSQTYPTNLGTVNAVIEMGLNTHSMQVSLQYKKQGSDTWVDFASDNNVNTSIRNLANRTIADYSLPMSGLYSIRPYLNANGTELVGNEISIDFNTATNTEWTDTTSVSTIIQAVGGTPYVETITDASVISYEGTLISTGWALISGDSSSLTYIGNSSGPIRTVRFNTTGTWVFKFSATSSDGTTNYTGSDLMTVTVGSSVIDNPEALLKYQDGTVGTKYLSFTDLGVIDIFGTPINETAPQEWEFSFRSTINEYGVLNQNFWPWQTTGFTIPTISAPNVAKFNVNRPLGMVELRVRLKDSNGLWSPYSNVLICSIDYSVTAPIFQPIDIPYLPNTGAILAPITGARISSSIKFKVRGNVVAPKFKIGYSSSIYYVEYDPQNVQPLPAESIQYNRTFNTDGAISNNPLTQGNFNCNTVAGRTALKNAIKTVLQSFSSLVVVSGAVTGLPGGTSSGGGGSSIGVTILPDHGTISDLNDELTPLGSIYFFTEVEIVPSDVANSDGTYTIQVNFKIPRGTSIANEPLFMHNPPNLARRVRVVGNITDVAFN